MPALNALSLSAAWSDVGGGGIGSDVRARDQRKPRPQCPHGSMDTLDREESGLKLVHGLACSGRTPCRSGRRALRESADVARNLYRIAYSCRAPLHQPYPVTRRLQSSTAIQPSTLYSSTALYSIQPLQHPSALRPSKHPPRHPPWTSYPDARQVLRCVVNFIMSPTRE